MNLTNYKKRALIALFFFITSCSTTPRQWNCENIDAHHPCFKCSRMILNSDKEFRGLQFEITRTSSGIRAYISTLSLSFPKNPKVEVVMEVGDKTTIILAERLEGGQRLLLTPPDTDIIIQNLLQGKTLTLSIGRYSSEIVPTGFRTAHADLVF